MTDTPTYRSIILDDGKYAIGQALIRGKRLKPYKFVVGDAFNFTPLETDNTVRGNVVYTGVKSQVTGSIVSKDQFKFSLTIPESAGPFIVGNLIFYVISDEGTVFPFISASFKVPYPKQGLIDNTVGNRFVFDLVEKIINVTDALDLEIQPTEYQSLAGYRTEFDLPPVSQAIFQQFFVQEPTFCTVPFIGARRTIDNSYWGLPLYSRVGDPFFGVLEGGSAGEKPTTAKMYWGGRLGMTDDALIKTYGGGSLADPPLNSIGGEPLYDNPGYSL